MNNWKSTSLVIIIALILSLALTNVSFFPFNAGLIGFLIIGLIVGYLKSSNTENAAINGAVVGFIGGFIFFSIINIMTSFIYHIDTNQYLFIMFIVGGLPGGILTGIFYGVICAVGEVIGAFIKRSRSPKERTA